MNVLMRTSCAGTRGHASLRIKPRRLIFLFGCRINCDADAYRSTFFTDTEKAVSHWGCERIVSVSVCVCVCECVCVCVCLWVCVCGLTWNKEPFHLSSSTSSKAPLNCISKALSSCQSFSSLYIHHPALLHFICRYPELAEKFGALVLELWLTKQTQQEAARTSMVRGQSFHFGLRQNFEFHRFICVA